MFEGFASRIWFQLLMETTTGCGWGTALVKWAVTVARLLREGSCLSNCAQGCSPSLLSGSMKPSNRAIQCESGLGAKIADLMWPRSLPSLRKGMVPPFRWWHLYSRVNSYAKGALFSVPNWSKPLKYCSQHPFSLGPVQLMSPDSTRLLFQKDTTELETS